MLNALRPLALAFAAMGLATPSSGLGYNSFVIEIPYEFSLPAFLTQASISCFAHGQSPKDRINLTSNIPLVNGQARGTLKLGFSNFGPAQDYIPLSAAQVETLKRIANERDMHLNLSCNITDFQHESAGTMRITGSGLDERITKDWNLSSSTQEHGPYYLDASLSQTDFEVTFRHEDNTAGAGQTATTTVPSATPGLQSLQSILQGE